MRHEEGQTGQEPEQERAYSLQPPSKTFLPLIGLERREGDIVFKHLVIVRQWTNV